MRLMINMSIIPRGKKPVGLFDLMTKMVKLVIRRRNAEVDFSFFKILINYNIIITNRIYDILKNLVV